MTPEDLANLDQELRAFAETFPAHLFAFFTGLVDAGFDESRALFMTTEYLKLSATLIPRTPAR